MANDPLSNLGQVLMGSAQDYASNKRQDDREARLREERLADVASSRAYDTASNKRQDDREARLREERLADVASSRAYDTKVRADQQDFQRIMQDRSVQNDIKLQLIHEGLLSPGDINNAAAIEKAFFEAQRRGLDVLYRDLFSTPGEDGKPLLNRADLSDPAKIEAAKQKLAEVKAGVTAFGMEQPKLAQKESTRLVGEAGKIQLRLAELEKQLSEPQPQPDANQVTKQAIQNIRALKKNPKYMPSQGEIDAESANVVPQLQQRLDAQWFQNKEDARLQYPILSAQLQNLRAEQSSITSKFGVAPTAPASVAAPTVQPVASRSVANPQQQAEALAAVIRGTAAPAPAASAAPAFAETFNDPIIQQANEQQAAQSKASAQSKLNALLGDISDTDQQIKTVQSPAAPAPSSTMFGQPNLISTMNGGVVNGDVALAPTGATIRQRASQLSDLYKKKTALQTEYERLKQALLGPQASVTPNQTNTSGFVQPQFNAPAPFAPSNLLEPAY